MAQIQSFESYVGDRLEELDRRMAAVETLVKRGMSRPGFTPQEVPGVNPRMAEDGA